jgi:hypothetical protein
MREIAKNGGYSYVQIVSNSIEISKLKSIASDNKYLKSKKYAFICKSVCNDNSEFIGFIIYSNDIIDLQNRANGFVSWYNYPQNLSKSINGYINIIK